MIQRTKFNEQIEALIAKPTEPISVGTLKIGGHTFPNGRQIAIQREDSTEINIWTEIFDDNDLNLEAIKKIYESNDTRSHHLKANAPNLAQPNRAIQFKFKLNKTGADSIAKQIESLLNCYGKAPFIAEQGDKSSDSSEDLAGRPPKTSKLTPQFEESPLAEESDSPGDESEDSSSYMSDPEKKYAVERVAVDRAVSFYQSEGFHVEEKGKPYDLLCIKDDLTIHVEVKGSTGSGRKVILTINEVNDAKNMDWRSDLFIVYGIILNRVDGKWFGTGGTTRHLTSWLPLEKDMKATQFEYSVP